MPTHAEQQKDCDCEAESVVVFGANDVAEPDTLKFGWRVFGDADAAEIAVSAVDDLKTVGVDKCDLGIV
jgi:hypothetical protein